MDFNKFADRVVLCHYQTEEFLYLTLCYWHTRDEVVIWTYNKEDKGFHHGHYYSPTETGVKEALKYYWNRVEEHISSTVLEQKVIDSLQKTAVFMVLSIIEQVRTIKSLKNER